MTGAFIVGLMDSEGFVAERKTVAEDCVIVTNRRYFMGFKSCDIWIHGFISLLQKHGLKLGKVRQEKPRKDGYKIPTVFNIKLQSWVDSGLSFVLLALSSFAGVDAGLVKILGCFQFNKEADLPLVRQLSSILFGLLALLPWLTLRFESLKKPLALLLLLCAVPVLFR